MSAFMKSATRKTVRWSAVPAAAALAVVVAAGPALAAGTSVGISTGGAAAGGRLTVSGAYQCATTAGPYAELEVTVSQVGRHGRAVESSTVERLGCTGSVESWSATLSPRRHGWFSAGSTRVDAKLWTPGAWHGQADASLVLNASAS